jgi:hypothetical protein
MTWYWLRRPRPDPLIDELIVPPVYRYIGADESLPAKHRLRRDVADKMRHRAAVVEAGATVQRVLTLTKRR